MKASAKGYQSESDVKGKPAPVDGIYHATIVHVNDHRVQKNGQPLNATIVEFEVLEGTVPGQFGKSVTQWYEFTLDKNGNEDAEYIGKFSRLCMSAKILAPEETKEIVHEFDQENREFHPLEGQQVVIGVQTYDKRDGSKGAGISKKGLDVWGIDNPEVATVPKSADAIRLWNEARGVSGNGNGNGNGNGPAMAGGAAAGVSSVDDI